MYVCLCEGITDGEIRKAYGSGVCTIKDLRNTMGVTSQCGRCVKSAKSVLQECAECPRNSDKSA